MGIIAKLKSLVPASSRSLHAMHYELGQMHGEMGQMWSEVGITRMKLFEMDGYYSQEFNRQMHQRFNEVMDYLRGMDNMRQLEFWSLYRRDGETPDEAHRRFFDTLEPARGGLRVYQLASAQLLGEFDAWCERNGLTYAAVSGTLLGTVRHRGFIPWDDDLDVGMPRRDVERAIKLVEKDERYRITVRYDRTMLCRQVRFCYADSDVPCFVDLFPYDLMKSADEASFERREQAREALRTELASREDLAFWDGDQWLLEHDAEGADLVASCFERYVEGLYGEDGIFTEDVDEADGAIVGIDNIDALVDHHAWYMVSRRDTLPLQRLPFEGHQIFAPAEAHKLAEVHYGDLYVLPHDIGVHFLHFSRELLRDKQTGPKLRSLATGEDQTA